MAQQSSPLWKQLFDVLDRRLSPTINELAKSDDVGTVIALGHRARSKLAQRLEASSRRVLHLWNLPAGSDVNRLLEHISRVEREVRDLRNQLVDRENADHLASLSERQSASKSEGRPNPPRKRVAAADGP